MRATVSQEGEQAPWTQTEAHTHIYIHLHPPGPPPEKLGIRGGGQ